MSLRSVLVGLIVLATVGFVIGTSIERSNGHHESAAQLRSEGATSAAAGESAANHTAEGGEASAAHASESGGESAAKHTAEGAKPAEQHRELHPFGIDIEAVPFVILASLLSLALAAAAWLRPRSVAVLVVLAVVMVTFGVLDLREIFHQGDEAQTGLAILAGVIAALHFVAAAVAVRMVQIARDSAGSAATIPG